ncbi:hypothetical protein ACFZBU_44935 [Embleya sp. NPDC008237]|uniref:hypothetical protein n=1 Tax=Embleya sp. NPDC008237 TaxID=3363978 RepID=UPI0036E4FDBE
MHVVLYLLAAALTGGVLAAGRAFLSRDRTDPMRGTDAFDIIGRVRAALSTALLLYLVIRYGWAPDGVDAAFNLLVAKAMAGAVVAGVVVLGVGFVLALLSGPPRGPALRRFVMGDDRAAGPVSYTLVTLIVSAVTFGFVRYSIESAHRTGGSHVLFHLISSLVLVAGVVAALSVLAMIFTAAVGDLFGARVAHPYLAPLAAPAFVYGTSSYGDVLVEWISGGVADDLANVPDPLRDRLQLGLWVLTLALSAVEIGHARRVGARLRSGPAAV